MASGRRGDELLLRAYLGLAVLWQSLYAVTRIPGYGDLRMRKKLTVLIQDDLDEKFRGTVFKKKGMHKGNITEAIEEAIQCWIQKQEKEK